MLLRLTSLRYLKQHPFLTLLSVLGVALGVAVVVAIDLTNVSARKAFELSSEGVTGKATHAVVGASSGVADSVYRQVRLDLGIRDSAPVVEGYVSAGERTLQVLGVDALAEAPFRTYLGEPGSGTIDLGTFMARPQTALLSEQTATALGLSLDDSLTVEVDGRATNLRIVGLLDPEDEYSERVLDNLLLTDIANAQSLLATENRLTRIDLIVPDGEAGEAMLAELGAALPDGVSVERSTARTETIAQMTRAFNLNLTALSFLALIVGMFLIYNTTTFSVVQRRLVIGRLRALGVSRGEIFSMVLGEALIVGIAGTVLGLLAGYLLATGLVQLVTQTINDLYYVVNVRQLDVEPWSLAKGVLLGIGATLAAAFAPARSATGEAPVTTLKRSVQEDRARTRAPWLGLAGIVLAAIGVGVLALPTRNLAVSYGGMLALLLAFAFATPLVLIGVSRLATPMLRIVGGAVGAMAGRGVASALSRTGIAVAALMVAIAA
ncbi:MAG: FtsX-like permease family protein, partial [Bacteroidota bacterium]